MTRKEKVDKWAEFVVPAVLLVEKKVYPRFKQRIEEGDEPMEQLSKEYCRAIAEEIIGNHLNSVQ
jgi:hypothetical protein